MQLLLVAPIPQVTLDGVQADGIPVTFLSVHVGTVEKLLEQPGNPK